MVNEINVESYAGAGIHHAACDFVDSNNMQNLLSLSLSLKKKKYI
jgi:hypothetical protein